MIIYARSKRCHKNLLTSIISLVRNLVENKGISDNIVSIFDCIDENNLESKSTESDSETYDNQDSECKRDTSDTDHYYTIPQQANDLLEINTVIRITAMASSKVMYAI
jgi:hypothetical protein